MFVGEGVDRGTIGCEDSDHGVDTSGDCVGDVGWIVAVELRSGQAEVVDDGEELSDGMGGRNTPGRSRRRWGDRQDRSCPVEVDIAP